MALQESELQVEQLFEKLSCVSPSSISEDDWSYVLALSQEDISGMDGVMVVHLDL